MTKVTLSDNERKILETYKRLEAEDPDGAWAWYYHEVAGIDGAEQIVKDLKRRKLLGGNGERGLNATYWINEKGKEALAA